MLVNMFKFEDFIYFQTLIIIFKAIQPCKL
jgi:hypothetical protein